ncbi:MAG: hypothetical protein QF441_10695 [Bacteriovoracaceae bacterium]|jgi:hypothetical protein|nr:hypothetical protein [Bacteriovoracaceae bacterium]
MKFLFALVLLFFNLCYAQGVDQRGETIQKLNENFLTNHLNEEVREKVEKMMHENPLAKLEKEEIYSFLKYRFDGSPIGKIFQENPKFLDVMVEIIHDKKALPALVSIVNQSGKMKVYLTIVLSTFCLFFFIGLIHVEGGILKRILFKLSLSFGGLFINIASCYYIFYDQLSPTVEIIKKFY